LLLARKIFIDAFFARFSRMNVPANCMLSQKLFGQVCSPINCLITHIFWSYCGILCTTAPKWEAGTCIRHTVPPLCGSSWWCAKWPVHPAPPPSCGCTGTTWPLLWGSYSCWGHPAKGHQCKEMWNPSHKGR